MTEDWRDQAACRDADPELFFPEVDLPDWEQIAVAEDFCAQCPVFRDCQTFVASLPQRPNAGIFAGKLYREKGRPVQLLGRHRVWRRAAA